MEVRIRSGRSVCGARARTIDDQVLFTWKRGTFSKAKARADFVMVREVPGAIPWNRLIKIESMKDGQVYTNWKNKYPDDLEEGDWRLDIAPNLAQVENQDWAIEQLARCKSVFSELLVQNISFDVKCVANKVTVDDGMLQRAHTFLSGKRMNSSQIEAAINSLKHRVCQVQGPPGTGKTDTCISILALNTVFMEQEGYARAPVLATSHTNDAVDVVLGRLVKAGLEVGRYGNLDNVSYMYKDIAKTHLVDDLAAELLHAEWPELVVGGGAWKKHVRTKKVELWAKLRICDGTLGSLNGASVVNEMKFGFALIDEAAACTEPAAVQVVCHMDTDKGRLLQCGDHKQLGPSCGNRSIAEQGLGISLFERLADREFIPTTMLQIQYRYHPYLASFPSDYFYRGLLKSGPEMEKERPVVKSLHGWGVRRILFIHTDARESDGSGNHSLKNEGQCSVIEGLVRMLLKDTAWDSCALTPAQIGVVTPYSAQRNLLTYKLSKYVSEGMMVESVNKFQGNENEVILGSLVRSKEGLSSLGLSKTYNG